MVLLIFFGIITQNKLTWILLVIITINSNQNNYATSNFTPPISSKMLTTWTKTKKIPRGHNSKTWPCWAKPMWFLDSAHQIHPNSAEKPPATIFCSPVLYSQTSIIRGFWGQNLVRPTYMKYSQISIILTSIVRGPRLFYNELLHMNCYTWTVTHELLHMNCYTWTVAH